MSPFLHRFLRLVPLPLVALLLALTVGSTLASWAKKAPTFAPDTRYYASMALHTAGYSEEHARNVVARFTEAHGYPTPPTKILFGWNLVGPRIVYPTLSAPFVRVLGLKGMLVVPFVGILLSVLIMFATLRRKMSAGAALVPVVLFLASSHMMTYATWMLTEGLAMLLVAATAFLWPLEGRPVTRRALWGIFVLMTLLAFTRQSSLIPAAAVSLAWLGSAISARSPRTVWLAPAAVTAGSALGWQVAQGLLWPGFSIVHQWKVKTHAGSVLGALEGTPHLLRTIVHSDVINLIGNNDIALLALLTLSLVAAVVRVRHADGQLLIGALLGDVIYNVANGTPTQFRYGEPGMVFLLLGVGMLMQLALRSAVDPAPADGEVEERAEQHGDGLGDEQRHAGVGTAQHDG